MQQLCKEYAKKTAPKEFVLSQETQYHGIYMDPKSLESVPLKTLMRLRWKKGQG
jgi:hypothetical protein